MTRPEDATRRQRRKTEHRSVMAAGLAASALVHALVLFHGRLTVPPSAAEPERRRAEDVAAPVLRLVTIAPEPVPPDRAATTPPRTAPEPAGAVEATSGEAAPAAVAATLEIPALAPLSAGRFAEPALGDPGTDLETYDLRPTAPGPGAAVAAAGRTEVEEKGPGLLRRVLGGILKGVSIAIEVPCGTDGTPTSQPVPGGTPVVPDAGGMPGLPGVGGGIPTGPDAVGMPEPEVIGIPAVPDATFGGTDGPVAGVDGRGALGGLIGCEDRTRGGGGRGGLGGGIFRPGGGL